MGYTTEARHHEPVDLLQELGLKEYESKTFVALSRMNKGSAREVGEHSDVPRTRVYDAIRVLEPRGLVEAQHTSPSSFGRSTSTRPWRYSLNSTSRR